VTVRHDAFGRITVFGVVATYREKLFAVAAIAPLLLEMTILGMLHNFLHASTISNGAIRISTLDSVGEVLEGLQESLFPVLFCTALGQVVSICLGCSASKRMFVSDFVFADGTQVEIFAHGTVVAGLDDLLAVVTIILHSVVKLHVQLV
jgi:hypothetical protein